MKNPIRTTFALLTACAALPAAGLLAQSPSPDPSPTPSVSVPAGTQQNTDAQAGEDHKERFKDLTPEEREKLKAAHKAALQDPAVKAAEASRQTDRRGYREAMRAAMLRADPSIAPILAKMREGHHHGKNNP